MFVYLTLFGVGKIIFGEPLLGLGFLAVGRRRRRAHLRDLNRRGWKTVME